MDECRCPASLLFHQADCPVAPGQPKSESTHRAAATVASFDTAATPGGAQQRFDTFHEQNPAVYRELVRLSRELLEAGVPKFGIRMVWEVMRWQSELAVARDGAEPYKLNDHYVPRYARLIMASEPDLAGVFDTRALTRT